MALDFAHYRHGIAIANGDLAGEIILRGWESDQPIELAASQRGDIIRDAVQAFLDVGTEVLVTCTDRANAASWGLCGSDDEQVSLDMLNRDSVRLFREAISDYPGAKALIVGAMGPPKGLFVLGELDEDAVQAAYRTQAAALAEGGADGLLLRRFSELRSLELAVRAARDVTDVPVIGSLMFECGLERGETTLGVTAPQACAALSELGIAAIGCDASDDPDATVEVISLLRASTSLPIWAAVHPGRPELFEGAMRYVETPEVYGQRLSALVKAGAGIIGGAAGVTTEHVAALVAARQRLK